MAAAAAATSLLLRRHRKPTASLPLLLRAGISSSRALPQQPELSPPQTAASDPSPSSAPLPPNPSSGSPFYGENWRNPAASNPPSSLLPAVVAASPFAAHHRMAAFSATLGAAELKETFAEWMAEQRWEDMKQLFEFWVRSLDAGTGKPNCPDVDLFNHYLRANLMAGDLPHEMLDRVRGGAIGEGPRGHGADRRRDEVAGAAARREHAVDEAEDGEDDEDSRGVLEAVSIDLCPRGRKPLLPQNRQPPPSPSRSRVEPSARAQARAKHRQRARPQKRAGGVEP